MATVQHANFIEHCRRAGTNAKKEFDSQKLTPSETNAQKIKVLERSEYERIVASLHSKQTKQEDQERRNKEKKRLKDLSQARVKQWGNTIAGKRKAKLEAKKIREEKEEDVRKFQDIEGELYQAEQRRKAIEHAKNTAFEQTDRAKAFHGALMLTEVLKERESQLALNKMKAARMKLAEKADFEKYKKEYKKLEVNEAEGRIERFQKRKKCQKYQLQQVEAKDLKREKELAEWEKEGVELRELHTEHLEEEHRKAEERENKKYELRRCHDEHLRGEKILKSINKRIEAEEFEEIEMFLNAKRRISKMRKAKERALFDAVQDSRRRMVDKLDKEMRERVNDEEERNEEHVKKLNALEDKRNAENADRLLRDIHEIDQHRRHQIRDLHEERERQLAVEREELLQKMEADRLYAKKQNEMKQRKKATAVELQNHHLQSINERAHDEREFKDLKWLWDQNISKLNRMEEEQFQNYATQVIDEARSNGRNAYPLLKAAAEGAGGGRGPKFTGIGGLRPSYMVCDGTGVQMPNYSQRKSTIEIKKQYNHGSAKNGKKRLGFVW